MRVLLIEPYYGGSHKAWADGYQSHSHHEITLLTMPAQFWKWRMQGGAVTMARLMAERNLDVDVILASDMFDLSTFRALTRDHTHNTPIGLYFHESQFTYPQNPRQKHGWQYGFINYTSALAADAVFFNSQYHLDVFLKTLPNMLKHFGDFNELQTVETLRAKSSVLPLGIDLRRFDTHKQPKTASDQPPIILWNHRWEEDKNPRLFFSALYKLAQQNIPFRLALTGENFRQNPEEFEEARRQLGSHIIHYGYVPDFARYARFLWEADYVVSTSHQDFFGAAVVEAIYCGCIPILPKRLNYPYILPEDFHKVCLYPGNALYLLLTHHLNTHPQVDTDRLQTHIAQFDWAIMAPQYDDALEKLKH